MLERGPSAFAVGLDIGHASLHAAAIERTGFEIKASDRLMFAAARFEPAIPHTLGTAPKGS